MPIETLLSILLSVLGAFGLHNFRGYFEHASKEHPNVRLKGADLLSELTEIALQEIDNEIQRPQSEHGEDYFIQRRSNSARILVKRIWDGAKTQIDLENCYQGWSRWEEYGYNICAYGWIFYALLAMTIVYIALGPTPLVLNSFNRSIGYALLILPIICVGSCYFVKSRHMQRFIKLRDNRANINE